MTLARLAPILFVFLWSTGWVVAKFADRFADPLTFLALRYAVAAALFYIVCRSTGAAWPKRPEAFFHALVSGILLHGLYLGALWWAIGQGVPAALSGIIAGLQPLMTGIAATRLVGERLSPSQRLGLLLGFVGIAIAVLPKVFAVDASAIPAFAVVVNIIGMAFVSGGTIYQKRYLHEGDIRTVATLQYVGALAVTLPAAYLIEDMRVEWGLGLFATLGWAVLGISMGAVMLLLYLIRRGDVSKAASLIYLVPPLAAVEAAIAFGEQLTVWMMTGTALAVAGVYLTNRKAVPKGA
ncbi:drug/metabolite transporter (DMT)-like permease [Ciceribacter lividus]|uniref:Drug/metabolite transporter (DMT)-like permease n=1 Tax=Ciceribacter lividus TaxID=1197950 RepID=A0A6I7HSF8_9HYPH|nr:DMT family transporter [Ciceribacter lividus]RCW28093.1 drug/metabolite transporter (DMT)-like permease [Ciceribacter lividus]